MEIVRSNYCQSSKAVSREDSCGQLRRILAENFPDEAVERLSIASDLEPSLSGIYVRGISRKGSIRCAFLAVRERQTQDAIESSLIFAQLWLQRSRKCSGKGHVPSSTDILRLISFRLRPLFSISSRRRCVSINDRNNPEYLFPEIEIIRVGLAESWRHGLRIVMRPMNKKI
jgi:hypothetical protein